MYGSLLSTAAYTAAVGGDRDTASTLIGEAADAASQVGDTNHRGITFGPTGVDLYRVSIARALDDPGTAIAYTENTGSVASSTGWVKWVTPSLAGVIEKEST
ncbi:hypothetical protein UO65_0162 [Actinokineospora spheciospongiae]|uniref:Uncharacterized protein n=1 Tax=Actinokineospora spheciospongiae TaxID=909613 RepID=W7IUH0_9PSEU|nr:hypothetical protein [Actinokineospora spheciospongiae]EWC64555.1 hypothetical protein UO65_0162 [Actinokineospora spheciospongiae]